MNPGIVSNLWLLPAVPFAAAVVILSLGKSRRKSAAVLAIGGQIVVLAISIVAFLPTLQTHGFPRSPEFHMVHVRRTNPAARICSRSACGSHAVDDLTGQPVHFCLQRRLHG